jgi:hypothetical protein
MALTFALWCRALVLTCCCAGDEQDFFAIFWMVDVPLFVILLRAHAWQPERIFHWRYEFPHIEQKTLTARGLEKIFLK